MQHSSFLQVFPHRLRRDHRLRAGHGRCAGFLGASRAADEPKAGQPRPALTVSTAQPQRMQVPLRLVANGNIAAWQEASIGAESNGLRLTELDVRVPTWAMWSKAGQALATFSADTVLADVAQSRASLLEAQANAAEAAANADRARSLQATGALSQQQIQQFTTAEQTAKARVEAAQAALNAQQLRLKYTQVVAPDSGVISARTATAGAVAGAGTELFRMVRKGRLERRRPDDVHQAAAHPARRQGQRHRRQRRRGRGHRAHGRAHGGPADAQCAGLRGPAANDDRAAAGPPKAASAPSGAAQHTQWQAWGPCFLGCLRGATSRCRAYYSPCHKRRWWCAMGSSTCLGGRPPARADAQGADRAAAWPTGWSITAGLDAGPTVAVRGAGFLNEGESARELRAAPMAGKQSSEHSMPKSACSASLDQALAASN